ncbi:MAG TPA: hypothetical protein PLV81_14160 [Spirochaetota bacterium]|nr:hypothetical protein [Spirochaetota bacterium]
MPAFVKYHSQLHQLMANYKGQILTTNQIISIFQRYYPNADIRYLQPSDHCINKTNNGACDCAMTPNAIFEYISRGKYRVI